MSLDYLLPGPDIEIVEHVIRDGWDGPGLIRYHCWNMTPQEAIEMAKMMTPKENNAIACRAFDTINRTWLDTGEPAWNPAVHKKS